MPLHSWWWQPLDFGYLRLAMGVVQIQAPWTGHVKKYMQLIQGWTGEQLSLSGLSSCRCLSWDCKPTSLPRTGDTLKQIHKELLTTTKLHSSQHDRVELGWVLNQQMTKLSEYQGGWASIIRYTGWTNCSRWWFGFQRFGVPDLFLYKWAFPWHFQGSSTI